MINFLVHLWRGCVDIPPANPMPATVHWFYYWSITYWTTVGLVSAVLVVFLVLSLYSLWAFIEDRKPFIFRKRWNWGDKDENATCVVIALNFVIDIFLAAVAGFFWPLVALFIIVLVVWGFLILCRYAFHGIRGLRRKMKMKYATMGIGVLTKKKLLFEKGDVVKGKSNIGITFDRAEITDIRLSGSAPYRVEKIKKPSSLVTVQWCLAEDLRLISSVSDTRSKAQQQKDAVDHEFHKLFPLAEKK